MQGYRLEEDATLLSGTRRQRLTRATWSAVWTTWRPILGHALEGLARAESREERIDALEPGDPEMVPTLQGHRPI